MEENLSLETIIEGLIFVVGDEGITLEQLLIVTEKNESILNDVINKLIEKYQHSHHGFELVNYGGIFKFLTKQSLHPYMERLFKNTKASNLSQSALETLAIIAYNQPIEKSEIEEIRGVSADHMLRKLISRNLIKEAGRSEAPGRPFLYEVTDTFMDSFKLVDLNELPSLPSYVDDSSDSLFNEE